MKEKRATRGRPRNIVASIKCLSGATPVDAETVAILAEIRGIAKDEEALFAFVNEAFDQKKRMVEPKFFDWLRRRVYRFVEANNPKQKRGREAWLCFWIDRRLNRIGPRLRPNRTVDHSKTKKATDYKKLRMLRAWIDAAKEDRISRQRSYAVPQTDEADTAQSVDVGRALWADRFIEAFAKTTAPDRVKKLFAAECAQYVEQAIDLL